MPIARETRNGVTVVTLSGRVDAVNAAELESILIAAVTPRRGVAVVDLAAVINLTTAGLRPCLTAARQAKGSDGRIVLAAMPPPIRALFDASGFSSLFETRPSVEDALASRL